MATTTRTPERKPEEDNNPGQEDFDKLIDKNFSSGDERMMEERAKKGAASPEDLAEDEKKAGGPAEAKGATDESKRLQPTHENTVGDGYKGSGLKKEMRLSFGRLKITKKRGIGAGIIAAILATLIAVFTITSGPLQLLHLAQILKKSWHHQEKISVHRSKGLFRYFRANNIGETRVGWVGSKVMTRLTGQLKDVGVTFETNSNGSPIKATIDTSKHPEFQDLLKSERRDQVIKVFEADPNLVGQLREGRFIDITFGPNTFKGIDYVRFFLKTSLDHLQSGAIATALSFRVATRFYDVPSLFHPLKRALAKIKNGVVAETPIETRQQEETRNQNLERSVTENPEAVSARDKVKDALGRDDIQTAVRTLNAALIGEAALCSIWDATGKIVQYNRYFVVLPTVLQAVDKMAAGSQAQSGEDFYLGQLGAIVTSFKDANGKTIWNSKPLQVLAGNPNPGGQDLPKKYGEAFHGSTTADNIRQKLKEFGISGGTFGSCGLFGQILSGLTNAFLIVAGFFTFGGTWATYAAKTAATAAAFAAVMIIAQQQFEDLINNTDVVPKILSGPLGGSLLAFGSREAANISARSSGGTAMPGTSTTTLSLNDQRQDQQQFQSEPFAKRVFDVHDYRSVISKLIDRPSTSPSENLSSVANFFAHPARLFSGLFSVMQPHVQAAGTYDWGFPQYGIEEGLATDPNYQDPYDNGDKVAVMLDNGGCADDSNKQDNGCSLRDRAMNCFGVDISKYSTDASKYSLTSYGDPGQWSAVAVKDVDPYSDGYKNARCDDTSTEWQRIKLFVFDSRLMDSMACYDNDAQSCTNVASSNG
ncbi:MAG TPA: hypothetical protein VLE51_00810 [Candidatus Saccharimonadales bacterium]|nr:hypothetical protein [Candidatus Saccharimonadales bacterium]